MNWRRALADLPEGIPVDVCASFERLALELRGVGFKRYSADAILHRVRWHMHVERGNRAFKANNNWTAPLARWFLKNHREAAGFFELRERGNCNE
jgi:hypothetical protein